MPRPLLPRSATNAAAFALASCLACAPRQNDATNPATDVPPLGFQMPPIADKPSKTEDGKAEKDQPKWDVNNPPGPSKTVKLDTDEGTWMSLDVSPDGKTIVFDLLGDLYRIPIEGGEATALTQGMAWDIQPTFSPDGRWIAFTSDRDGADNIWVIATDGSEEPRQITNENFRLVNSPAWSPDGQFIAARKHFTARRSLGTGEIWMYHIAGGKGLRLTKKVNDQKDVGEPAFSPDGRYLYFSLDATPGKVFEYNKNPHAGIYEIRRLDRSDGRIESYLSSHGGAIRPTPSPDGRTIAFVRRKGLHTSLYVHDIETGAERGIYHDLDRDMQETWAIHGVYPAMEWTPDAKSIVFWAGGQLRRIDVKSAEISSIPFHVAGERKVSRALRSPIKVHPETFHTKMLRWVQVAPNGKSVVFQALGHLYTRSLPKGKPKRLTSDNDVFEFYPSFSRDGRSIVYTTWNDDKLGSVRVIPSRGGRSTTVSVAPGHYTSPAFSPDGKSIVYRKVGGGGLRSKRRSHDRGIYVTPAQKASQPRLVSRSGYDPHFGADGTRVFFVDTAREKDERKTVLKSVELTRAEERTHLLSKNATEFRVSPDGRWIAFREGFNAYVAPFPATGRPFDIGPKSEALPVTRVSKDAGEYLHWSGDSTRIHWSLGPSLFGRELKQAFSFVEGAPEELPKPPETGLDIGFDTASDSPRGTLYLVGARIITMKGDQVIDDGVLVVEGNRIKAIGTTAEVNIPNNATRIDLAGKTIIPGLVDVHAHGPQGQDGITPQQNWLHYATLAFGVTTIHDPSNDTATIFAAAELARAGMITAPRIFSTGTILYGAKAPFKAIINNLDDARAHLRRMKAAGAFSVKSYNQPRRNQRQQVIAAARELDMMVVPEGGSLYQHNMNMVVDGHTGIEHATPLNRGYKDMRQLWAGTEVGYTPTLVVGYGGLWGENYWYAHTNVFENRKLQQFVPPSAYEPRARRRMLAARGDWNHINIARLCKQLLDDGVKIQLGAHGQREGLAAHWELWMFVQGGMTPLEALRSATLSGAEYLGLDQDIGSLEVGKLADLAVLDGNPLVDIRTSERVTHTMVGGRLYDATTMDEVAPGARARKPFYWQKPGG